jgi:hypothetical protein
MRDERSEQVSRVRGGGGGGGSYPARYKALCPEVIESFSERLEGVMRISGSYIIG